MERTHGTSGRPADGDLGRAAGSDLPSALPALPEGESVRRPGADERDVPRVRLPLRARAGLLPGGDVRQLLPGSAAGRAADVGYQRVAGAQLDAGEGDLPGGAAVHPHVAVDLPLLARHLDAHGPAAGLTGCAPCRS